MSEVTIKRIKEYKVVSIEGKGLPYDETMGPLFKELFVWIKKKDLEKPTELPLGIAIYTDDPDKVSPEECRFIVAVPIKGEVEGDERVKIMVLPETEAVCFIHKGPYSKLGSAYQKVFDWIHNQGYRGTAPPRDFYLNDCYELPEDEFLTEIQAPVKKK